MVVLTEPSLKINLLERFLNRCWYWRSFLTVSKKSFCEQSRSFGNFKFWILKSIQIKKTLSTNVDCIENFIFEIDHVNIHVKVLNFKSKSKNLKQFFGAINVSNKEFANYKVVDHVEIYNFWRKKIVVELPWAEAGIWVDKLLRWDELNMMMHVHPRATSTG